MKLSKSMTETEFDNGYWYATEIKEFAREIGIPSASKLRKDELEALIKHFLRTGKVKSPDRKNISRQGIKDIEKGLSLSLPIVNYTSNRETKQFIEAEAGKIIPDLKKKSGARYRLNRWREEQINKGIKITYGDLVKQYISLNQVEGRFEQIPVGRYINFLADFLAEEKTATRLQAIEAWEKLKTLNIPKNYKAWKKHGDSKSE
ncbi:SAP domain-containing protein [Fulvivirgaceae bacterium BMA12]|uniref:SAP domain-containing protein n=1 Tax=Agaribacillus aureus TaxID=3051825 RepID=A0ABT8L2W0_9BACT|nr:SAP domain-containing protein [Fulvivirgaceae bacterium BMA12]